MKYSIHLSVLLFALIIIACNNAATNKTADATTSDSLTTTVIEIPVTYTNENDSFKSFAAYKNDTTKRPVILIVPEWWGVNDYVRARMKQLATLGYFVFIVDMYGQGTSVSTPDSAGALAIPFYKDPLKAKKNFEAALTKAKSYSQADTTKIAAMGYCFGGGMVLNMMRLNVPLQGVISFHGDLDGYGLTAKTGNKTAVLVCHGEADSMVDSTVVKKFKTEMDNATINYTFIAYPNAKHAFTNPNATATGQKYKLDIAYNEPADKASWQALQTFLQQLFN